MALFCGFVLHWFFLTLSACNLKVVGNGAVVFICRFLEWERGGANTVSGHNYYFFRKSSHLYIYIHGCTCMIVLLRIRANSQNKIFECVPFRSVL